MIVQALFLVSAMVLLVYTLRVDKLKMEAKKNNDDILSDYYESLSFKITIFAIVTLFAFFLSMLIL
jgi:hypothetical protein